MLPLGQLIKKNSIAYHSYADDTQIYLPLMPNDYTPFESLCHCIYEIDKWMSQNFLQLNKNKTEVVVFGKKEERQKISALLERKGLIAKYVVKNLGVLIDNNLHFSSHIKSVTKSAYFHLKNINKLRGYMSKEDLKKSYVHSSLVGLIIVMYFSQDFPKIV